MICPNKICNQEIPDDSCFCDQCGVPLMRCDKCGFIGANKFCVKCGGSMSAIQPPAAQTSASQEPAAPAPAAQSSAKTPSLPPAPSTPVSEKPVVPSPGATVIVSLPAEKVFLCHPEGWNIETADGDILGRTNGPHASALGKFPVISSNHAKVTRRNGEWFITDLNSTNKTYINGVKLEPDVPVKIKQDDVVLLANVTFTVRTA
jgi:hypothetical protein